MLYSLRMYVDTHCHLDFAAFDSSRSELMSACLENNIRHFLVPSTTYESWQKVTQLALIYPMWRVAFGLHPYFLHSESIMNVEKLGDTCEQGGAVAIGEIGLDFWPDAMDVEVQKHFFGAQLSIARELNLPIILHARKSYDVALKMISDANHTSGGIVHAFNGSLEQAKRFVERGFLLGIGGTITYPRAKKAHRVVQQLEDQAYVLETDSPDMPLHGFQGQMNTPLNIPKVAFCLADLRGQSVNDIAKQAKTNLLRLFPEWYGDER
ncbi:putative deoxyribonuclease YjjV [Marinomonas spartinae]|uniref:Putative deoxyribonuclease YjjV n=1 Tax=Marinomonas spartinae TaxID=1792290 RepID=A0A1A8TA30_9GAMM|nr:TatD family hydrolase [Marinomonas spartinae]SBS28301.1 putative deoxyribonuclease YjjV [Marinomonas spartinae]SBS28362.1 putative deoxyribonuclease YjjV [Marinomonas spartinae]